LILKNFERQPEIIKSDIGDLGKNKLESIKTEKKKQSKLRNQWISPLTF